MDHFVAAINCRDADVAARSWFHKAEARNNFWRSAAW
jgi:hypothetical protein